MSRRTISTNDSSDDEQTTKRRKLNLDIEERLESLISRVGDKSTSSSLESNLEGLATVLEADLHNHKTQIIRIICECVRDLPQRVSVYSTLVGLINIKNYDAGGDLVEAVMKFLKGSLRSGDYDNACQFVYFLSDLVNCKVIMTSSIIVLYNTFIEAAMEDNSNKLRSDWLMYVVMSSLVWSAHELSIKKEADFDRLLKAIEKYISQREKDVYSAFSVWNNAEQVNLEKLDTLWRQIQSFRMNRWEESVTIRPYVSFDSILREALQHTIPQLCIPPPPSPASSSPSSPALGVQSLSRDELYPLPKVLFRLFDNSDLSDEMPRYPDNSTIERFIVEETIHSIIRAHCHDRKLCADALLGVVFRVNVPLNYLLVETLFGELFQLPFEPHLPLMYGALLIEMCKQRSSSMPQVIAQGTVILYDRLNTMNTICIERFSNWFAYHLSNFQFKWSWDEWVDCLDNYNEDSPKTKFIVETLRKCGRLSYHQRVIDIVPPTFNKLLPPEPLPDFKYKDSQAKIYGQESANKLMEALKSKRGVEEVVDIINQVVDEATGSSGPNASRIDVFFQTLLHLASKTISHSFSAIAKYHSVLKALMEGSTKQETTQLQVALLTSLHCIWKNKPQIIEVIIDKLLKTQIINCSSVVAWVFSEHMSAYLTSFYISHILNSTLNKMHIQLAKTCKELEVLKKKSSFNRKPKRQKDADPLNDDDDDDEADDDDDSGMDFSSKRSRCDDDEVDREESKVIQLKQEIKIIHCHIIKNLVNVLSDHIHTCENDGVSFDTPTYKILKERLQEFLYKYHEYTYQYTSYLSSSVFTGDVDNDLLHIYNNFTSLMIPN